MKYIILVVFIFISLSLTGCGAIDRGMSKITGNASEVCHDDVIYLQFTSGATVKYLSNGKIATCKI